MIKSIYDALASIFCVIKSIYNVVTPLYGFIITICCVVISFPGVVTSIWGLFFIINIQLTYTFIYIKHYIDLDCIISLKHFFAIIIKLRTQSVIWTTHTRYGIPSFIKINVCTLVKSSWPCTLNVPNLELRPFQGTPFYLSADLAQLVKPSLSGRSVFDTQRRSFTFFPVYCQIIDDFHVSLNNPLHSNKSVFIFYLPLIFTSTFLDNIAKGILKIISLYLS